MESSRKRRFQGYHEHAGHGHDGNQRNLCLAVHLELPDQNDGENRKGEVADDAESAVEIGEGDDDVHVDAVSVGCAGVLLPEEGDRLALKQSDEKEDDAGADGAEHDKVNDPDVDLSDGNSKQEPANGDFGRDHRQTVPEIAKPPELTAISKQFSRRLAYHQEYYLHCICPILCLQYPVMTPSSIVNTCECACNEESEENLRTIPSVLIQ